MRAVAFVPFAGWGSLLRAAQWSGKFIARCPAANSKSMY